VGEGIGPGFGADVVEGGGFLAAPVPHSIAEPGLDDLEAGDLEVVDLGFDGFEFAGAYP